MILFFSLSLFRTVYLLTIDIHSQTLNFRQSVNVPLADIWQKNVVLNLHIYTHINYMI